MGKNLKGVNLEDIVQRCHSALETPPLSDSHKAGHEKEREREQGEDEILTQF